MEQFFTPTRCFQDRWELNRGDHDDGPFEYTEVKLAVPVEDFLSYRWDWKDFRAFLTGGVTPKIMWITENTYLAIFDENRNVFWLDDDGVTISGGVEATFQETSGQKQTLILSNAHEDIPLSTGACNVFWRALTTSNSVKLAIMKEAIMNDGNRLAGLPSGLPSGPFLSRLLRESPSLQVLLFMGFDFKEEHCLALATLQRQDLKVKLRLCTLEPQDALDTFIEWFRHNQVVTELECCEMENNFLSALSGNNSVKTLAIEAKTIELGDEQMRSLAHALPGNMAIETLAFTFQETMSDETWVLFFRSLSTHPCIKFLYVSYRSIIYRGPPPLAAASKTTRMNAVIQMLHLNTVVHSIRLPDEFHNEEVYHNSILPRLEMNRNCFEVQRQAVKRADPSIRPQLLGRALHAVRYNPNLVFQFLSENVPAFVRTEEEEEEEDSAIPLQNDPAIVSGRKRKAL
jgi:hypothetical protein